jgi:transcriptional regulator with XRE-family HTH domain
LREVALAANVDKNTILRLEAGLPVRNSSRDQICKVYGVLNIPPEDLPRREIGAHYAKNDRGGMKWHRAQISNPEEASTVSTNDEIQDSEERRRQGRLNLAQQFFSRLDCDMPAGRLRAGIFEVYGTSGYSSQQSGEALVYVLKGNLRFEIGEEVFVVREGESATFDRTIRHLHEPFEMEAADLPVVVLYVQVE